MEKNLLEQARKELAEELTPVQRAVEWAKEKAVNLGIVPGSVMAVWSAQQEAEEHYRVEEIQDRIFSMEADYRDRLHEEWAASPAGQKWEREQEELAHFGKVLTANDYAEKRADLENDSTIDRGDIGWMMEKWAGNPKWREMYDRDAANELKSAHEHEERMVRRWEASPEGKQLPAAQDDATKEAGKHGADVAAIEAENERRRGNWAEHYAGATSMGAERAARNEHESVCSGPTMDKKLPAARLSEGDKARGEWTHKDNVIYDRETRMCKALSAGLLRGDIVAASPSSARAKPKDRDFDMEM